MQKTVSGNILRLTAGSIAKSCCCGGTSPSVCTDGDPEIYLTIGKAAQDQATSITWCGQTWSAAQINANSGIGTQKGPICPTTYDKGAVGSYAAGNMHAFHYWRIGASLSMARDYNGNVIGPNQWYFERPQVNNKIQLKPTTFAFAVSDFRGISGKFITTTAFPPSPVFAAQTSGNYYSIGILTGFTFPRFNNYALNATFYNNSYTASGIKYTWEPGNGW